MNMEKYSIRKMNGSYSGGGWEGNNSHKHLYGAELAKAIREEFKANKIKGVTVRSETYSGGQSITITLRPKMTDFIPFVDYEGIKMENINPYQFGSRVKDLNGNWISINEMYNLPREEYIAIYKQMILEYYEEHVNTGKSGTSVNEHNFDLYDFFTEEYRNKLKAIKMIVDSFNYDDSDIMTDYFCRGFYDHYTLVCNL